MAPDFLTSLRSRLVGEVDAGTRRRAEYSTDASNYRVVPQVVAFPRDVEDVVAALEVARTHAVPVTSRGGGTSVAGNAVGPGLILDFSRHLNQVLAVDPQARTARVQPGVVLSTLQAAAKEHGLRFGPDPSTQNRATVAGMIGNNACGPHALSMGSTAENVISLEVVDGYGRRFTAEAGDLSPIPALAEFVANNLALLRTQFGRFSRQISGYSLEHLLPERGHDLPKFLVGTEGTLVTILEATVRLVPLPKAPVVVALGYPDMPSAADDVPNLLPLAPLAIEGLDAALVEVVRSHRPDGKIPSLPPGAGWLLVEVGGENETQSRQQAQALAELANTDAVRILPPGPEAADLWRIRADGAGLAGRTAAGRQAWPGWEDAAVPPQELGNYLRAFEQLMERYGVSGLPYGHFGDGCIHIRIDFPLADPTEGPRVFKAFMRDSARLVAAHGGSLSGEHGDGRARGELLPFMYSQEAIAAMAQVKELFDPENHLNPGVVVDPQPLEADLRRPQALPLPRAKGFSFAHDGGDFTNAVHRCVGVGKCRADSSASGGFMCPSYLATRDEKDSTRARARVLQELANGSLVQGWNDPAVQDSLDLCLSCKACSSDCPAGVDMAQYKSEALNRAYQGRLRPINHYSLGWLPTWARLITAAPVLARLTNAALGWRPLAKVVLSLGGMDPRRGMLSFTDDRFSRWWRRRGRGAARSPQQRVDGAPEAGLGARPQVVLWVDSFSEYLQTEGAQAFVALLERAGYEVLVPPPGACCGLTLISTGQLAAAKDKLRATLDILGPYAQAGLPIVGVEPSCTAALRSDLLDLLPEEDRAATVAGAVQTVAEFLTRAEVPLELPDLRGRRIIAQPHCHQYAVMGYHHDLELLRATGAQVDTLAGCCGLAGNFGMEKGHYEVSVAVGNQALVPTLEADPDAIFLADGLSCRTQAEQLAGREAVTLTQLLLQAPTLVTAASGARD